HPRAVGDAAVVAHDAAVLERHARLQRALTADDRAVELAAIADVRVAPDDGAVDDRAVVDGDVVTKHGRSDDLRRGADLDAVPEEDRAGELSGWMGLGVAIS